jgi:hypothetical protein
MHRLLGLYLVQVLLGLGIEAQKEALRQAGSLPVWELESLGLEVSDG